MFPADDPSVALPANPRLFPPPMSKLTVEDLTPRRLPGLLYQVFSSFFLAMWVLVFMTLVTLFGTLYQVDHGLFAAKQKYFHSWFLVHRLGDGIVMPDSLKWLGSLPVPLPGGFLLMLLLTINLSIGALGKVKKRLKGAGMLVAHFGMIFLLVSGFVTHFFGTDGYMALYEGQSGSRVESYRSWQLEILPLDEDGAAEKALVIPPSRLEGLRPEDRRVFRSEDLPFEVEVTGYAPNGVPVPVSAPVASQATGPEVDGFRILAQRASKEAEQNLPALVAYFRPKSGGEPVATILSARSANFDPREFPMAFGFEVDGRPFAARLVKETWEVPFEVRLDQFIFERHPGVSMARNYESRIVRVEDGAEQRVEIKMNEPMRHAGFTFFQESFGPADAKPGEPMYSQFAVANNPADQWPLWSLVITGFGLMAHFLIKLFEHTSRPRKAAAAAA